MRNPSRITTATLLPAEAGGLEAQEEARRMLRDAYPYSHLTVLLYIYALNDVKGLALPQRHIGGATGQRSHVSQIYWFLHRSGYIRIHITKRGAHIAHLTAEGLVYLKEQLEKMGYSLTQLKDRILSGAKVRIRRKPTPRYEEVARKVAERKTAIQTRPSLFPLAALERYVEQEVGYVRA